MKLLFIIDPPAGLDPKKDTTIAFMQAAAASDHHIDYATISGITYNSERGETGFLAHQLIVYPWRGDKELPDEWMQVASTRYRPAKHYDCIFMRKEPPVDSAFTTATRLLDLATQHTPVLNHPTALRRWNEKLSIFNFPKLILPTWVGCDLAAARAFYQRYCPVVLKPLDKMGGQGVYLSGEEDLNFNSVFGVLSDGGLAQVMLQQAAPRAAEGDRRVFVVCGEPFGWMLTRQPDAQDFRANMAAGGTHRAEKIDDEHRAIAAKVGKFLKRHGISFAGLDVVGGKLTEINITCPTGLATIRAHRMARPNAPHPFDEKIVRPVFKRLLAKRNQ